MRFEDGGKNVESYYRQVCIDHKQISQLIPIKDAQSNNGITELNKAIVAWGPTKSTSRSPVVIVDNNTGFNTTTDTVDGEHPNTKGDLKLADKFFQPLVDAIKAVS